MLHIGGCVQQTVEKVYPQTMQLSSGISSLQVADLQQHLTSATHCKLHGKWWHVTDNTFEHLQHRNLHSLNVSKFRSA